MEKSIEDSIATALEFEWGQQGGFFFDYRDGKFNEAGFKRTYQQLVRLDFKGQEKISKKIVALIWSIPFFLICNDELVVRKGGSRMLCDKAIGDFGQLLMDKLETE